jgi:hypothetical protein
MITGLPPNAHQIITEASLESGVDNSVTDDIQQSTGFDVDQPDVWEDVEEINIKDLDEHAKAIIEYVSI